MASGGIGGSISSASDVQFNNPANGEVLKRNGGFWVNNPLTKTDIGLSNVDNTSDAVKPVSTATQTALSQKLDAANLDTQTAANITNNATATATALSAKFAVSSTVIAPGIGGVVGNGTADDTAALQALIDSYTPGTEIKVKPGTYKYTSLNFNKAKQLVFQGPAGWLAYPDNTRTATFVCTAGAGTARGMDLRSIGGCEFVGIHFGYSNAAFNGTMLDLRRNDYDTAHVTFRRCEFYGVNGAASALIDLDGADNINFIHCRFTGNGTAVGVQGSHPVASGGFGYSNTHVFDHCWFELFGAASIMDPGNAWVFNAPIAEPLSGSVAGFISHNPGAITPLGLTINGIWCGDAINGGVWIKFAGSGLSLNGGYMSLSATATAIKVDGNGTGYTTTGTYYLGTTGSKAWDFSGVTAGSFLDFGVYGAGVVPLTGTPSGYVSASNGLIADAMNVNTLTTAGVTVAGSYPNMLSLLNSQATTSLGFWIASSSPATVTRVTSLPVAPPYGTTGIRLSSGATPPSQVSGAQAAANYIAYTPGQTWTFLAYFLAATVTRSVRIKLFWLDSNKALITSANGPTATDSTTAWTLASYTTSGPAGAAYVSICPEVISPAANEDHYFTDVDVHQGTATTYTTPGANPSLTLGPNGIGTWTSRPVLTYSRTAAGESAAVAAIRQALAAGGFLTDSTTA